MTANAARAVKATRELVNAVPFLGGSDSEDDYREALELVEYLIEEDDTNPLIDFLASRIAEYESNNEKFAEFDKAVAAMPVGVALLRTLIDQHNLRRILHQYPGHAGTPGFLRGHLPYPDGGRLRGHGHRRFKGRGGADHQAV